MTIEEIEERWNKAKKQSSVLHKDYDEWGNCWFKTSDIEFLLSEVKRLREGIGEVLDGTLPYLAEKRLTRLLEGEHD